MICCMQGHIPRSKVKVTVGTQSLCIPDSCQTHNFIMHCGFENYLIKMIIVTGRCVACINHVPRSKVKVMADTLSSGIPE